jgi:hypothetical protein
MYVEDDVAGFRNCAGKMGCGQRENWSSGGGGEEEESAERF